MTYGAHEQTAAFAEGAADVGAVLRVRGETIVSAIESLWSAQPPVTDGSERWLLGDARLLSRGDAWIVPLSWEPPESVSSAFERQELSARSTELWGAVRGACEHHHGIQIGIDLSTDGESRRTAKLGVGRCSARHGDRDRLLHG